MDLKVKLEVLSDAAKYDASCASSGSKSTRKDSAIGSTEGMGICHSYTPDGRCVSLLKILLTNYCIYDCQFCINRISSDVRRARFRPEEVVKLTLEFYRRNYIEGLFLSSGIFVSPDHTMEQLVRVAKTLREEHRFGGYIHLKTIPGASDELIEEAGLHADRLSVNIELPTEADLRSLAPEKSSAEVTEAMTGIRERRDELKSDKNRGFTVPRFTPAGQSTQMIVGATPSPDAAILKTASDLYTAHDLKRVYYSAFSPIPHAADALPNQKPPMMREHRLYQADWLMRFYGFDAGELTTPEQPDLELDRDPKLAWALRHREQFPVDLQTAPRELLLRIPGLGQRSVDRIIAMRPYRSVRLADLKKLRVPFKRVRPFVLTADHNPFTKLLDQDDPAAWLAPKSKQLSLFDAQSSAVTGQV